MRECLSGIYGGRLFSPVTMREFLLEYKGGRCGLSMQHTQVQRGIFNEPNTHPLTGGPRTHT